MLSSCVDARGLLVEQQAVSPVYGVLNGSLVT